MFNSLHFFGQTYPPFENTELFAKLEEYKHADRYLQEHKSTSRVGTLSQSEWEAASKNSNILNLLLTIILFFLLLTK